MNKMNKLWTAALLLIGIFLLQGTANAQKWITVNGQQKPAYREGEVIVKYRDGAIRSRSTMEYIYDKFNVLDVKRFSGNFKNFEQLIFNPAEQSVEAIVDELSRDPAVEYAQPNYMLYAMPIQKTEVAQEAVHTGAEPCMIPGVPYPPGCEDNQNPGEGEPCLIPGVPYPPGCKDEGSPPTPPGNPGNPGKRPAIQPPPAEVNPPVADPDLSKAYGINKIGAPDAWKIQRGSKNIVVAVIDTGIDYNHPDLAFNIWRNPNAQAVAETGIDPSGSDVSGDVVGWDFIHNDNLPYDDNEHGTHCAGVIGAVGGDGKGISGVNQRVSLMAVKFLSAEGSGDTASAIKSVDYAVSRGAKVLSNSWGGKGDDGTNGALKDAIERAGKAGVLVIAAAGNDGTNNDRDPVFPASYNTDNMIAVAATTESDSLAFFSNTGDKSVHVGAPGTNVYSTVPGNKYQKLSGTSMACPHVAGAAALLWAQHPDATYQQIKRTLLSTGDSLSSLAGKTVTGKRINVFKALQAQFE